MCAKKLKKNKGKTQMKCQNVIKKKGKEKKKKLTSKFKKRQKNIK